MHILAVTADWHVNDTCALCPPAVHLDRGTYAPSKLQRAIYRAWCDYWSLVSSLKVEHNATVIAVHNGDLGDLNSHSTKELISTFRPDVERALTDIHAPVVADLEVVNRGTCAHNGGNGELEEWFASDLTTTVPSPEGTSSWWVFRAEIGGVRVHITHHPPTSTRIASKHGQAVSRMCERLAAEYNAYGWRDLPHLAIWSHVHWSAQGHEMGIEGWTTPPWKGLGAFGHRIGVSLPNPVGGLIITIPGDGTWKVNQFLRHPPRLPLWKPS